MSDEGLRLLDELRVMAQNGLRYADDPHDERRYERLFEIVTQQYGEALDLTAADVRARFEAELGHVTPKVGAAVALFDDDGDLLLMKRTDSGEWNIPGGFVDAHESPAETAIREAREETGLTVTTERLVGVYRREPYEYRAHAVVGVVYLGSVVSGARRLSEEGTDLRYWSIDDVPNWHPGDEEAARDAFETWQECGT